MVRIAVVAAVLLAIVPGVARASSWSPEPATYGVVEQRNVGVTMADGVVLRADVYSPADARTGVAARGPFPVLLTQTPYGKDSSVSAASGLGSGANNYFVQRGYIEVVADVRGTGASGGQFGLFDPVQATDGATLVRWAAHLPHSTGTVGLFGASYMGINQLLTAGAVGPGSPIKAIFPEVAGNNAYRDFVTMGGLTDAALGLAYLGGTSLLNLGLPFYEGSPDVEGAHVQGLVTGDGALIAGIATGGTPAYDGPFWAGRSPSNVLGRIVANGIPAYLLGGWFDAFQRGALLNFVGLQNAWAGRPVGAPMTADQPVTGRYQLMMGPWYHTTAGTGIDLNRLQLSWFDTWLKGEDTGITDTTTPLHLNVLGTSVYKDEARWPLVGSTTWHLDAGGTLGPTPTAGADTLAYTGISGLCGRPIDQWTLGGTALLFGAFGHQNPCSADDRITQLPPGAVTYTTAPFAQPMVVAGPIGATLYATANTTDTSWIVELEDVAPDGTSVGLTEGALLGSFRAVDPAQSWRSANGNYVTPWHPFTKASSRPVTPNALTRYDIEVWPTVARLAAGHRLRVTVSTADFPHLLPIPSQAVHLLGGIYQLQHTSTVELPLVPASTLGV